MECKITKDQEFQDKIKINSKKVMQIIKLMEIQV